MKDYVNQHLSELKNFCEDENISVETVFALPKCYSSDFMFIQTYDKKNATKGLTDNTPADIVLIIRKGETGPEFELTDKGKILLREYNFHS